MLFCLKLVLIKPFNLAKGNDKKENNNKNNVQNIKLFLKIAKVIQISVIKWLKRMETFFFSVFFFCVN